MKFATATASRDDIKGRATGGGNAGAFFANLQEDEERWDGETRALFCRSLGEERGRFVID